MGKLNEFNRDEINMVLQKLLQNLSLDALPHPSPFAVHSAVKAAQENPKAVDYNHREYPQGEHI